MVAPTKCSCTEAENSSADVAAAAYEGQATETSSLVSMERQATETSSLVSMERQVHTLREMDVREDDEAMIGLSG
eukprot:5987273-Pyramimonas_sp.AAC.2